MRSIPFAMTWELLQRGRWPTILALLGSNLVPVLILTALRMDGAFDPTDRPMITMQFVVVQMNMVAFAAAILAVMELPSRTYSLPVPTSTLVAWRMIPSMVLIFVETLFSLTALNIGFGIDWPVWGPALVAPVALAMIQAALWYSEKSSLVPFSIAGAAAIIGFWFKSRYGPLFSQAEHLWTEVTPLEVVTLVAFALVSYGVAIVGVARNRRGDILAPLNVMGRIEEFFSRPIEWPRQGPRFQSPREAHVWCEWTKKGILLPGVVGFVLVLALSAWLIFSRDPAELVEGLFAGGAVLAGLGLIGGLIVGNYGRNDTSPDIGSFLATRPLTNHDLSRITLRIAARAVLTAWAMWLAFFAIVVGLVFLAGTPDQLEILKRIYWWYYPATLLGCWIVTSTVASIYLCGRTVLAAKVAAVLLLCSMVGILLTKLLDDDTRLQLLMIAQISSGLTLVAIAIWTITAALRRSLMTVTEVLGAVSLWVGLAAVTILISFMDFTFSPGIHVGLIFLLAGLASLTVVPFAAAPLAIAWNRHR